jgi:hypothetical protein
MMIRFRILLSKSTCAATSRGPPLGFAAAAGTGVPHGRAVQVDTIKPKLIPHGTKRLKLEYNGQLSNFGFKFNLRCYTMGAAPRLRPPRPPPASHLEPLLPFNGVQALVGQCRLDR